VTLLDQLFEHCDSIFLQRVVATASVSIFKTPICVTNGVTVPVPAPGNTGLTFRVNSDDLGLSKLIVPGFDVLFTGVAAAGADGSADRVVWTASAYPANPAATVAFQLPNSNTLAIDIERVSGSVTTTLSPITPRAFMDNSSGRPSMGAILLEGPAASDQIEVETSFGPVTIALDKLQLVAVDPFPAPPPPLSSPVEAPVAVSALAPATDSSAPPTFTVKLKPAVQGNGGEFRIAGMAVPFSMKLVGANEEWSCQVQLRGKPGLVTVTLTVSADEGTKELSLERRAGG
jgi:hypothetical protein